MGAGAAVRFWHTGQRYKGIRRKPACEKWQYVCKKTIFGQFTGYTGINFTPNSVEAHKTLPCGMLGAWAALRGSGVAGKKYLSTR